MLGVFASDRPSFTVSQRTDGSWTVSARSIDGPEDVFKACVAMLNACADRMGGANFVEKVCKASLSVRGKRADEA